MTIQSKTAAAILAVAGAAAFLPSTAKATLIYNDGDLLLGFRSTGAGSSTDFLVDLGPDSSIINSTVPITFSISGILANLNAAYGGFTGTTLWSVAGVQKVAGNGFIANTMFVTRAGTALGTNTSTPWARPSAFAAGAPAGKIQTMGNTYKLGTNGTAPDDQTQVAGANVGLSQSTSHAGSYRSFMPGGSATTGATAFGQFNDVSGNGIEGTFANGVSGAVLDLYTVAPGTGNSVFAGNITIDSAAATVSFTPPVPEPSTVASLVIGAGLLGAFRRRRSPAKVG